MCVCVYAHFCENIHVGQCPCVNVHVGCVCRMHYSSITNFNCLNPCSPKAAEQNKDNYQYLLESIYKDFRYKKPYQSTCLN